MEMDGARDEDEDYEKQTAEGDPSKPLTYTVMEDLSRKRTNGTEHGSNPSATTHGTEPGGNQLAIVPVSNNSVLSPPPKRDPKRTRVATNGKDGTNTPAKNLAGSLEGRRRAQ